MSRHSFGSFLVLSVAVVCPIAAVAQSGPAIVIHRVALDVGTGVMTVAGAGLGPALTVWVDGQPATVLPGATTARMEVVAPNGAGQNRTFIAGIAGTVLTTPAVQVFVDANGQLGTLVPPPLTGTIGGTVTPGAVEQRLAEQQATIAELRTRLARLEALLAARARRR
jgi:hypothetical protein